MLLHRWLDLPYAWPDNQPGLLTGLDPIDRYFGGLQPGQLLMLCSYDDIAAKSLQYSISLGVAKHAGVLFCGRSPAEMLCRELLCEFGDLPLLLCLRGLVPSDVDGATRDALGLSLRYPFEVNDRICRNRDQLVARLEETMKAFQQEQGRLGLVVLDGLELQLLPDEAKALRELAQRQGVALLLNLAIPPRPFRERDPFWDASPGTIWGEPYWDLERPILGDIEAEADILMVLQLNIDPLTGKSIEEERLLQVYRRQDERWIWSALHIDAASGAIAYDHTMISPVQIPFRKPQDPYDWEHCDHELALKDYLSD